MGVGPELLVGLCVERSLEMVISLLGILKAGGAYVPLEPSYPCQRLHELVRDAVLVLVLCDEAGRDALGPLETPMLAIGELLPRSDSEATAFDAKPKLPGPTSANRCCEA